MNTVIAIKQKGRWIQVWNLDYEAACEEARNDLEDREIAFIDSNDPIGIVHQRWQAEEGLDMP